MQELLFALLGLQPGSLQLPVQCEIGKTCLIQKLVDLKPGAGRLDYGCGTLTTEEHGGVDIRLLTVDQMRTGVRVLAAAAGTVTRMRDGEADGTPRAPSQAEGREAGNGVVIDHGDGWETQYAHLRNGSVSVAPGQQVAAGDPLGVVGMSGDTEYPHLHFELRHRAKRIDPFTGASAPAACGTGKSLWSPALERKLAYKPTAIIQIGFSAAKPDPLAVRSGEQPGPREVSAPAIVLWADVAGARPGDVQRFTITGPAGDVVHSRQTSVEGGGLSWFAFSGLPAPASGWRPGTYTGRYELLRGGAPVASMVDRVRIR